MPVRDGIDTLTIHCICGSESFNVTVREVATKAHNWYFGAVQTELLLTCTECSHTITLSDNADIDATSYETGPWD